MRVGEIAELLARDAEGVCRKLLPNGKRAGKEWQAGDIHGSSGKSLSVSLTGSRAGTWKDFAESDSGGDLIDLFAGVYGLSMVEAIAEAKLYLGIQDTQFHGSQKPVFTKPDKPKCVAPAGSVLDWLMDERALSLDAINAYNLAEVDGYVVFPSLRDGELIRWKRRHKDAKHKCQTSTDSEPCLFGWQAIPDAARAVVICEGEIDAVSWWQMGYPALSVPNGAQGHTWIEYEYDNLERFDKIYLSMDNDESGQKAIPEIVDRLGRDRCRIVKISDPYKDANDLLKGNVEVADLVRKAGTLDPAELKSASEYVDEIVREFYPPDDEPVGFATPWEKVGSTLLFRKGEVTVLAGTNGHGKSELACQLTLDAANQGVRACVASMEFKPKKWLMRITRQCGGLKEPSIPFIREIASWYGGRLWVFDAVGTAQTQRILDVFSYARRRYGIGLFVIDNLAKCGFAEDDYNGQKNFVDQLTDFAKEHDVHVILVAHLRKAGDEDRPGNKFDVKGSGAITDMVDTVLIIWRNKAKEEARSKHEQDGTQFDEGAKYDGLLLCSKQRNGESEPRIALWFDTNSHQFIESARIRPKNYVNYTRERTA